MGMVILITIGVALLMGIIVLMPNFPPTPDSFNDILEQLADFMGGISHVLIYIFGTQLFLAFIGIFVAVMVAEPVYHGVMWVLRKIPVLGIK